MPRRPRQPEFSVYQQKAGLLRPGQRGFTIIELTCVIVIIGCLAATAIPKFVDITSQAKRTTLIGMATSLRAASDMMRVACLASADCKEIGRSQVTVNGITFDFFNGYLDAGDPAYNEIDKALVSYDGFTLELNSGHVHRFTLDRAQDPATCYSQYIEATKTGPAVISILLTGC
jgi:MSHA pilin protein MshA